MTRPNFSLFKNQNFTLDLKQVPCSLPRETSQSFLAQKHSSVCRVWLSAGVTLELSGARLLRQDFELEKIARNKLHSGFPHKKVPEMKNE